MEHEDAVEDRLAADRSDHVIVGPGTHGPAPVLEIVVLEHHRDMRPGRATVGAQAAAHLEPGELRNDPVDEGPAAAFDQLARAGRRQPLEGKGHLAVAERLEIPSRRMSRQNRNPMHAPPSRSVGTVVTRPCDALMTVPACRTPVASRALRERSIREGDKPNPSRPTERSGRASVVTGAQASTNCSRLEGPCANFPGTNSPRP